MTALATLLVLALLGQAAQPAPAALDVRHLAVSSPTVLLEIDTTALPGQPTRLAWSPDGRELYVRLVQSDHWGNERVRHFVVSIATLRLAPVTEEPAWSAAYWIRKSALAAPGRPDVAIAVEARRERKTATGVVSAGSMAQSGGDPNLGSDLGPQGQAIAMSTIQAQQVTTTTMRFRHDLVGEFVNVAAIPGLTYGWSPSGAVLAFVNAKRYLVLADSAGHRHEVRAVKDALLPAWSDDGARLACLRRAGGKKFAVTMLDVSAR